MEYNLEIIIFLIILIFLFTARRHILIWPLPLPVNLLCFSSQSVTSWGVHHHRPADLALRSSSSPWIGAAPCTNVVSFVQTVSVALWENNWQRAQRYKQLWTFSSLHPFFFVQCRKMSVSTTEPSTRCDSSETFFFFFSLSVWKLNIHWTLMSHNGVFSHVRLLVYSLAWSSKKTRVHDAIVSTNRIPKQSLTGLHALQLTARRVPR